MPGVLPPPNTIATTTCLTTASGTECITEYPYNFHVQDAGNITFGLAIIITIMFFALTVWLFSLYSRKG